MKHVGSIHIRDFLIGLHAVVVLFALACHTVPQSMWLQPSRIFTSGSSGVSRCWLAVSGSAVHAVYEDTNGRMMNYIRSTDDGLSWSAPVRLDSGYGYYYGIPYCLVAASGTNAHLFCWISHYDTSGTILWRIHYRHSTNAGALWSYDTILPCADLQPEPLAAAAHGSSVYLAYPNLDNQFLYTHSYDNGATWPDPIPLAGARSSYIIPSLAAQGDNVYVAYGYDSIVYCRRSTDAGASWDTVIHVTVRSGGGLSPLLAASGSNLYCLYSTSARGDSNRIICAGSDDNGLTWTRSARLNWNTGPTDNVAIGADGSNVCAIWPDGTSLLVNRSDDCGRTWSGETTLTQSTSSIRQPTVVVSGTQTHVGWAGYRSDGSWLLDYYYTRSIGTGP